jgi:predicted metal-dependent hydrolase
MYINDDAALIVKAPFKTSEEVINKVVLKYMDRLQKTQKEIQLRNLKFKKKEFINGERFLYLGNYYNLKLVDNREILLDFKDEFLLSKKYLSYAKNIFIIWYKRRAYETISQMVREYAQKCTKEMGFLFSPRQSKFYLAINYGTFTYRRFRRCS